MNVKKLLEITQPLVSTKEPTPEQNHISVLNVENRSAGAHILLPIKELTQGRNPTIVNNVAKHSENAQPSRNMK